MKLNRITTSGIATTLEVQDSVFGAKPNKELLAQAVHVYLSNQRQGTSKTKTRSDINRTKKKWYKQKGTGNARHGARTPSIFVGGGVAHGPNGLQNWSKDLTKQQKKKAMVVALSSQKDNILVLDGLASLSGKTKEASLLLKSVAEKGKRILAIFHESVEPAIRSLRNLDAVEVSRADRLNIYETLHAQKIVMTEEAVRALEKRLGAEEKKSEVEKEVVKTVKKAQAPKAKEVKKVAPKKEMEKAVTKKATKPAVKAKTKKAAK